MTVWVFARLFPPHLLVILRLRPWNGAFPDR